MWRDKKLLVDLDGTMLSASEITSGNFQVTRSREDANVFLPSLRAAGASCFITTSASSSYVHALTPQWMCDLFDRMFTGESLMHALPNGKMVNVPKHYGSLLDAIKEKNPLRNCVIIGNEPHFDVPIYPMGVLTLIVTLDTDFYRVLELLVQIADTANGHFAFGFDRLCGRTSELKNIKLVRTTHWQFDRTTYGMARVAYFDDTRTAFPDNRSHMWADSPPFAFVKT